MNKQKKGIFIRRKEKKKIERGRRRSRGERKERGEKRRRGDRIDRKRGKKKVKIKQEKWDDNLKKNKT